MLCNPSESIRFRKDGAKLSRELGNQGYNSPTSRLGHEIIHGWGDLLYTAQYDKRRLIKYDKNKTPEKAIFTPEGANIGFPNEEENTTLNLGNL